MRKIFSVLTLAAAAFAQPPTTTVNGPIYDFFGKLLNGSVVVQGPVLISTGQPVSNQAKTVTITNGALTLQLVPNDTAIPTATQYVMTFNSGEKWNCIVKAGPPMPFANDQTNGGACTQSPNNASLPVYQFLPITGEVTIDQTGHSTVNAATTAPMPSTIVRRDASGNGGVPGAPASGTYCLMSINQTISWSACTGGGGGGGGSLSLSTLTNGMLSSMTNGDLSTLTN